MTSHTAFMRRYGYLATKHYTKSIMSSVLVGLNLGLIIAFGIWYGGTVRYANEQRYNYAMVQYHDNIQENIAYEEVVKKNR